MQPIWMVAIFTFCTGLMGVFLAIPMKRQMINHEQLPFPSGIAAAETLKSLYSESREAVLKAYSLVISLACGAIIGIINTGSGTLGLIDKVLGRFRLPEQIPEHGFATVTPDTGKLNWFWGYMAEAKATGAQTVVGKQLIQFGFEPSVLLIAAGMIVGLRVSLTMLAGSILLYVFVAPKLIAADTATIAENTKLLADPALLAQKAQSLGVPAADYAEQIRAFHPSFDVLGGEVFHVYRWALWGGTSLMVVSSLTALAFQWKTIGRAVAGALAARKEAASDHDEAMKKIEVPLWWMIAGMIPLTIAMVVLQIVAFNISWYAGVIAVLLSFILSLVACRATGETDTTPIGAMGKVMQLTFALLHPKQVVPNLASAGIAANSASSSADLLTDLKSGYLLGANPRKQFLAQFFGCFFGTVAILPVWYLMVPTKAALEAYPAPGTQSWYRVAQVLTQGFSTLPDSSKYALAIGIALGVILPIMEKFVIPEKYRKYWPSTMGLGLSWVVGFNNSLAFALGSIVAWVWGLINKKSRDTFNVPIASGLVAGESLIKAAIAMLATISGIAGWNL
ncbi:MAG: OPT family oligopeptide transporter [Phycisphaerales bacterium]